MGVSLFSVEFGNLGEHTMPALEPEELSVCNPERGSHVGLCQRYNVTQPNLETRRGVEICD